MSKFDEIWAAYNESWQTHIEHRNKCLALIEIICNDLINDFGWNSRHLERDEIITFKEDNFWHFSVRLKLLQSEGVPLGIPPVSFRISMAVAIINHTFRVKITTQESQEEYILINHETMPQVREAMNQFIFSQMIQKIEKQIGLIFEQKITQIDL